MAEDGWIPVNPRTLETRFPDVYAVGDVATQGTPKAGVFAEGAARAVAATLIAQLRGPATPSLYAGTGSCYIEFGAGRIGRVDVDFFSGPVADGRLPGAVGADARPQGAVRVEPPRTLVRPHRLTSTGSMRRVRAAPSAAATSALSADVRGARGRPDARHRAGARQARPNQRARRLAPNCCLSARSSADGALEDAGRRRAGQEVDVDAADAVGAELDVAGARARVACRRRRCRGAGAISVVASAPPRPRRTRRPSACRRWRRRRSRTRPGTGSRGCAESTGTSRRPSGRSRPRRRRAVLRHAEEEVEGQLVAVVEHDHAARRSSALTRRARARSVMSRSANARAARRRCPATAGSGVGNGRTRVIWQRSRMPRRDEVVVQHQRALARRRRALERRAADADHRRARAEGGSMSRMPAAPATE